jgi:hypothetical protein
VGFAALPRASGGEHAKIRKPDNPASIEKLVYFEGNLLLKELPPT